MAAEKLLVLGTRNRKKGLELAEWLAPYGFTLKTLADYPQAIDVVEDGTTFAENAALKATQQAVHLGCWVLGEDSGLCVDALDGAPGIFSARFSGEPTDDERNNNLLLEKLADVPWERRSAHYVCSAAVANARGEVLARSEGRCYGRIRSERSGAAGFGYDPLFEVLEYHRTFGELGGAVKGVLSHRSRALRLLLPQLLALGRGSW
jgi:XTP/dITP diphosphohydrolase